MNADITLRNLWDTRPVRLPRSQGGTGSLVAGVCEGIGVRYRIDPTVVRVAFAAAFLCGGGLTLYLLCWLLMPRYSVAKAPIEALLEPGGSPYKEDQRTGIVLVIALLLLTGTFTVGLAEIFGGTTGVTFLLAALALYGLHSRQPVPPQGLLVTPNTTGPVADLSSYTAPAGFDTPAPAPPAWDPLGAAPELWHLPEPQPPAPPTKSRKTAVFLLVAGSAVALLALPIAMFTLGVSSFNGGALTQSHIVITNENELADNYTADLGDMTVDLSNLPKLSKDTTVKVTADLSDMTVILPEHIPSTVTCTTALGTLSCQGNPGGSGPMLNLVGHSELGDLIIGTRNLVQQ